MKTRKISKKEQERRLAARRESLKEFTKSAAAWTRFYTSCAKNYPRLLKTAISRENSKIGKIYNVSLIPIISCGRACHEIGCDLYCYARYSVLGGGGYNGSTMQAWTRNLVMYRFFPERYFSDIVKAMKKAVKTDLPLFRWHVGGEIPDFDYLIHMAECSKAVPDCIALAFTTRYDLVKRYEKEYGAFPENLRIILSAGPDGKPVKGFENYACTTIITKGSDIPEYVTFHCPGKCEKCRQHCWYAKPRECIGFDEH